MQGKNTLNLAVDPGFFLFIFLNSLTLLDAASQEIISG